MSSIETAVYRTIEFVDSHTAGEPTRVVTSGFPDLPTQSLAEQLRALREQHDEYRRAVCTEPRAAEIVVGALLLPPMNAGSIASVIFFNNVGYLGMCGHGAIGVVSTLQFLGRIAAGTHALDTPVGTVQCTLLANGEVEIENVPAYRYRSNVRIDVTGYGPVTGDVAWGGNWFFLVDAGTQEISRAHIPELTRFAQAIRASLAAQGVSGEGNAEIDHIELFGAPRTSDAHSRNFVLCPGAEYDRSPCGTGTSAKLACLAADGKLAEGETWIQESVIGSRFSGRYRPHKGDASSTVPKIIPSIKGRAFICGAGKLLMHPDDPFAWGIN
jgi:4-hydroxyproline epimerase